MLSVHLVLEICGIKVVVSFNFAPSAPHVKPRVKSCEPRAAAAIVNVMRGDITKNQKQIQRLRHQSKEDNDLVLNVETNNRFAVLADECTSDEPVQTSASKKNVAKKKQKKVTIKKTRKEKTSKLV